MTRTNVADSWITETLMLMRHNSPNADSDESQISKLSPKSLYQEYSKWCTQARQYPLQEDGFRGRFYTIMNKLNIVMRTRKHGSKQCWFCGLRIEFRKEALGFAEKAWVQDLLLKHSVFHKEESRLYEADAIDAMDPGRQVLSLNADGAASRAHTLPCWPRHERHA